MSLKNKALKAFGLFFGLFKVFKIFSYSREEIFFIMIAWFWLIIAKVSIFLLSFNQLKKLMGEGRDLAVNSPIIENQLSDQTREKILLVKYSIGRAARLLPFHCQCLVTAITARKLLKKLNYSPDLYLGVAKDPEKGLAAHAWVKLGDVWVTGQTAQSFTIVKVFS